MAGIKSGKLNPRMTTIRKISFKLRREKIIPHEEIA